MPRDRRRGHGDHRRARPAPPPYQPIFSLATGDVVGFEGLVGPIDASRFPNASALFAGAESADRTVELDMACLVTLARGVGTLPEQTYLSVNISPRTLESEHFQPSELVRSSVVTGSPPTSSCSS